MLNSVLIIDDDQPYCRRMLKALEERNLQVQGANNINQARKCIEQQDFDGVVLDLSLGDEFGLDYLPEIKRVMPRSAVVVLTGFGSIATALSAVRKGASDFLTKPATPEQIILALSGAQDSDSTGRASKDLNTFTLDRAEWEHIQRVLTDCNNNVSLAAKILGLHRRTLQRKLSKPPIVSE